MFIISSSAHSKSSIVLIIIILSSSASGGTGIFCKCSLSSCLWLCCLFFFLYFFSSLLYNSLIDFTALSYAISSLLNLLIISFDCSSILYSFRKVYLFESGSLIISFESSLIHSCDSSSSSFSIMLAGFV